MFIIVEDNSKNSFTDDTKNFPLFARSCRLSNLSGQTLYCSIIDDPNRQLLNKVVIGGNAETTGGGVNVEFDWDKSIPITQSTRLLHGETIMIALSQQKARYLTVLWKDAKEDKFLVRCVSIELRRGHTYTFDKNDLTEPLGFVKTFI